MNISALRILVAVAEAGSFSEAALELEVSQSAVSRAIAALEKEWGVSLLSRGRFGAKLTPVGERLMHPVREMIQLDQKIGAELERSKGLSAGRVRIASFRSAATHLLPAKIAQFSRSYPQIEIQLTEAAPTTIDELIKTGRVDLGLVPLPRSSDFETWDIADDEFVVLLPPTRQPVPKALTWEMLSRYSFILYSYAECTTAVQDHWDDAHQCLKVAYEIKEDSTIVSMVAQGLGAAILPKLAALPIPEAVEVRSLPVPLHRRIGVAALTQQLHPPAVFAFLDLLRGTGLFAP